ncbi:CLUMA_CG002440, isoform A [Clunio marinus]|uniref:CLUMA_CG002440, isoform A n=1 Tax=Clunio marinus TaxID=568069 RepID=A0A1J1HQW6_9DIPT|nr:CLUMA_CG002440, isoform A [Clunio marinus]
MQFKTLPLFLCGEIFLKFLEANLQSFHLSELRDSRNFIFVNITRDFKNAQKDHEPILFFKHSIAYQKTMFITWSTSATYANLIAKLKEKETIRELVDRTISDYGIYCAMLNWQQIPTPRHGDPMGCVVCRIEIYH